MARIIEEIQGLGIETEIEIEDQREVKKEEGLKIENTTKDPHDLNPIH